MAADRSKATAVAHPIQGLIKYHGLRDQARNLPYHDSVSVCTAPSATRTTVELGTDRDVCVVDGAPIDATGHDGATTVLEAVRRRAGIDVGARVVSENSFPANVGLGASASAFAALATAASAAAGLDLDARSLSALARRGSTSAARSVAGGVARLYASTGPADGTAARIDAGFEEAIRIVVCHVPRHKHTERAHAQTARSHLFRGRQAYVQRAVPELCRAVRAGDFDAAFGLAERDSLALLAATMTGPEGWLYWAPRTLRLLERARELRAAAVPVYFSADTGATAYLNTTAAHVDAVREAAAELGVETEVWRVGGPPRLIDDHLF